MAVYVGTRDIWISEKANRKPQIGDPVILSPWYAGEPPIEGKIEHVEEKQPRFETSQSGHWIKVKYIRRDKY